jgi:hypothetical protein
MKKMMMMEEWKADGCKSAFYFKMGRGKIRRNLYYFFAA